MHSATDLHRNRILTVKWNKQILLCHRSQAFPRMSNNIDEDDIYLNQHAFTFQFHSFQSLCFQYLWTRIQHIAFFCFLCVKRVQYSFFGSNCKSRISQCRGFHSVTSGRRLRYNGININCTKKRTNWWEYDLIRNLIQNRTHQFHTNFMKDQLPRVRKNLYCITKLLIRIWSHSIFSATVDYTAEVEMGVGEI